MLVEEKQRKQGWRKGYMRISVDGGGAKEMAGDLL